MSTTEDAFHQALNSIVNNHAHLAYDKGFELIFYPIRTLYVKRDLELIGADENQIAYRFKFWVEQEEYTKEVIHTWTVEEVCFIAGSVMFTFGGLISIVMLFINIVRGDDFVGAIIAFLIMCGCGISCELIRRNKKEHYMREIKGYRPVDKVRWEPIRVNGLNVTISNLDLIRDANSYPLHVNRLDFIRRKVNQVDVAAIGLHKETSNRVLVGKVTNVQAPEGLHERLVTESDSDKV